MPKRALKQQVRGYLKPRPTEEHCSAYILNFACQLCSCIWPPRRTLSDKHILLVNVKAFLACHKQKNVRRARVYVVVKPTNVVLDKQNFKCLPNNVCPFGRSFTTEILYNSSFEQNEVWKIPHCHLFIRS